MSHVDRTYGQFDPGPVVVDYRPLDFAGARGALRDWDRARDGSQPNRCRTYRSRSSSFLTAPGDISALGAAGNGRRVIALPGWSAAAGDHRVSRCVFFLLVATLLVGTEIKGARRWISIAGFSLQPSEFVKPALAVVCAWMFAPMPGEEIRATRSRFCCLLRLPSCCCCSPMSARLSLSLWFGSVSGFWPDCRCSGLRLPSALASLV